GSILLFLRDWRTTIIATLAIPTSMVGAFAFMYGMGFTINNFTMIGMILAVGIVVDDAVVVHENIFRHMEEFGRSAWEAARTATAEIALAVVATTLSLVVVFAPIAFMGGQIGRFFSCFGYVVGFSVLLSMFISFTMTPMLCSRFLKLETGHGASSKSGFIWRWIENSYLDMLAWSLRHRWAIILLALGILFSTVFLLGIVGFDFVPKDDQSEFEIVITKVRRLPGVTHSFIVIGDTSGRVTKGQGDVTRASMYYRMLPLEERDYTQASVMQKARAILSEYPDLRAAVQDVAAISASGFRQVDVDLNILGPDMNKLKEYSDEVARWMKKQGVYVDVDSSISLRKPELRIRPDRERLSDLGVSLADVSNTTNILVGGVPVSKYKDQDEQYDVWLRAELNSRDDQEEIARMIVPARNAPGGVTQLGNVVHFEKAMGPNTIDRFSRQRQVVVSSNLQGIDLSKAVEELGKYVDSPNL
ncbi:MAG TPA: efflux RND transporter permease subunit, partial [Gemmatales bacterium]|nr:efflux RND transporter permease subunit [Gemmatales bacterium]